MIHDRATLDGYCGVFTGALVDGQEDSVKDEPSNSTSHTVSSISLKICVFMLTFCTVSVIMPEKMYILTHSDVIA